MPAIKQKTVAIRQLWPDDVHKKIRTYQKQISLTKRKEYTFEEATIEFIREYEFARLVG